MSLQTLPQPRRTDTRPKCACAAYTFRHTRGNGLCKTQPDHVFCGDCGGLGTYSHSEDQGWGHYEYAGATGCHTHICTVSDCCGAEVFSDSAQTKPIY